MPCDGLRATARRLAVIAFATMAAGCSADAAPEPEPTATTPGAFIAVHYEGYGYQLWRCLSLFAMTPTETLVFVKVYAPYAQSLSEARELAKDPDLLVKSESQIAVAPDPASATVVWYRSLTDEELEAL